VLLDVREADEWESGRLPGAVHLPRGRLELRIESLVPDRGAKLIVYCEAGTRSLLAAEALGRLGYSDVSSLAGGVKRWKDEGLPLDETKGLGAEERRRYARHLAIPEVGEEGQRRLLESRVLLIGAGGLGSPAALYLAAAGVGTLGVVDHDLVDDSNLQRQVLHATSRLGRPKVDSARQALLDLNPGVEVRAFQERLSSDNVERILAEGWDLVLDGCDNFPTRYLVNDACVKHRLPNVHGSVFRFDGQVTVFWPGRGPCYRCLYPQPPPPELAPNCAEAGVLGVLPGVIGLLEAVEALKILLDAGEPLTGRLLVYDALAASFTELKLRRDPDCTLCADGAEFPGYVDYEQFCSSGG
jgi:molybdopterin/thiamine biosynthesis adenylyltransferase/rhodanese-related sulfurtransferase